MGVWFREECLALRGRAVTGHLFSEQRMSKGEMIVTLSSEVGPVALSLPYLLVELLPPAFRVGHRSVHSRWA